MDKKEKIELMKTFQNELEKHGNKTGFDEVPSWHHGLMESMMVLENVLGLRPDDWDDS